MRIAAIESTMAISRIAPPTTNGVEVEAEGPWLDGDRLTVEVGRGVGVESFSGRSFIVKT